MQSIPLTVDNPGTFAYTEGQTYYNEKLAHSILEHAYSMSQEGYEIAWEELDEFNYAALWTKQTASLFGLVDALNNQGADALLQNYYEALANELNELTTLEYRRENYDLRAKMIATGEKALALNAEAALEIPQPLEIAVPDVLQVQRMYPIIPEELWNQQTAALTQQSALVTRLQETIDMKLEQLPAETTSKSLIGQMVSSILEEIGVESFFTGLRMLLKWLSGAGGGFTSILAFLMCLAAFEIKDLWDRLTQGKATCTQMLSENTALNLDWASTASTSAWEYYHLRETVIIRHQNDIHNLLTEIIALEERTSQAVGTPTSDMSELIQAVKDLGYNGTEFVFKDGSSFVLQGKTLSSTA